LQKNHLRYVNIPIGRAIPNNPLPAWVIASEIGRPRLNAEKIIMHAKIMVKICEQVKNIIKAL
jgi:hypothetical protein